MGKARTMVGNPVPTASRWTLGVAVAAGVVLGALVAPGPGGPLPILALPEAQAPGWGAAWGADALGIDAALARDLGERIVVVAVGVAALLGLALLTALLRLVGEREAVRPGLTVRWALGRSPRTLAAGRLAAAARPVGRALAAGVATGLAAALAVRLSWPVEGIAQGPSPALLLLLPLLLAPLALALIWPVAGLETRAPELLRTGRGGTDDPKAGTVRRVAATLQLAAAAALVLAGATLGADRTDVDPEGLGLAGEDTVLVPLRPLAAGFDWGDLERLLGATAPESLSTPGAWTGRGVRDLVTVECGQCVRGGLPLPIYGVRATVHAVSSGFFAAAGMDLVEGRGFAPSDRADSEAVAIVTAAFARNHFEGGRPLGRHIRLSGGSGEEWLRVVGVVEELDFAAPGSPPPGEAVLYLALAQHPASEVVWSTSEAPPHAEPAVSAGVTVAGPVLPLLDVRRQERAPVRWTGAMLLAAGWIGLALSLLAGADTARAEVRGRWREAAIRASVGAPPRRLAFRYLKRAAHTAVIGALVGWILAWSVVATFGAGAHIPFAGAAALAALLLGASLAGAWAPSWRAAAEDPAVLLRDGG